ncbi:MAG: LPS export ABC transporter periplasmic protein LptC, partial [Armatimonadota bacterium]|nr:LPS export ABC transporter periplasmic protein LptC [Armatimonadota bacterium]
MTWRHSSTLVGATALLCVVLAGCHSSTGSKTSGGKNSTAALDPLAQLGGHFDVKGGEMTEWNAKGELAWKLRSPQTGLDFGQKMATIKSVEGTLYQGGQPSVRIHAPLATIDSDKKVLQLAQGVKVESVDGLNSFSADRVSWLWQQSSGLEASGHVLFHRGAASVTAGRLQADVSLRTARLLDGPVAT